MTEERLAQLDFQARQLSTAQKREAVMLLEQYGLSLHAEGCVGSRSGALILANDVMKLIEGMLG